MTTTHLKRMILSFTFFITFSFAINAQASHAVNASGTSFTPANLTINIGDTVIWTNTSGFHNVNATLATYPSNPEGFGNALASATWVFKHTFTIAGTYDYQCDAHLGNGMVGQITVLPAAGINGIELLTSSIFPVPAKDVINVKINLSSLNNISMKFVDLNGKILYEKNQLDSPIVQIDSKDWNGIVFYQLFRDKEIIESKKIVFEK